MIFLIYLKREETGKLDSYGKLIIQTKVVHADKKHHSNDRKKKIVLKSSKLQDLEIPTNTKQITKLEILNSNAHKFLTKNESFNNRVVNCDVPNSYSPGNCNNCDECRMSFKNSVSSDGSLSDYSKNSECDECRYSSCSSNCSISYFKYIPTMPDASNCSVVGYPWGLNQNQNVVNQSLNVRQSTAFHHVPFPWRVMVSSKNMNNLPVMNMNQNIKYQMPNFIINNYNSINNMNGRPILNRNV